MLHVPALLEGWVESGEELHAPAVLPCELANAVARLAFDGDLAADDIANIWAELTRHLTLSHNG